MVTRAPQVGVALCITPGNVATKPNIAFIMLILLYLLQSIIRKKMDVATQCNSQTDALGTCRHTPCCNLKQTDTSNKESRFCCLLAGLPSSSVALRNTTPPPQHGKTSKHIQFQAVRHSDGGGMHFDKVRKTHGESYDDRPIRTRIH
jgi:hypothetical protein